MRVVEYLLFKTWSRSGMQSSSLAGSDHLTASTLKSSEFLACRQKLYLHITQVQENKMREIEQMKRVRTRV